ncbi:MAG: hypothetical protein ABSG68_14920 [Thermoguttaceae bacterium]
MVLLTFTIAILNLCLGYALAVYLGFGPPSLAEGLGAVAGLGRLESNAGSALSGKNAP